MERDAKLLGGKAKYSKNKKFPMQIYRFNSIPITIPTRCHTELDEEVLECA